MNKVTICEQWGHFKSYDKNGGQYCIDCGLRFITLQENEFNAFLKQLEEKPGPNKALRKAWAKFQKERLK